MTEYEQRSDQFTGVEERYAGHTVRDINGEKIGKVDDLFVDENDRPEYIGVKMGFLGLSGTTLIPMEVVQVDEGDRAITVSQPKERVQDAPSFDDDAGITPEFEQRVRDLYGLSAAEGSFADRGPYGAYYDDRDESPDVRASRGGYADEERLDREHASEAGPGMTMGDREAGGEFRTHDPAEEGIHERGADLRDTDELRVQRSEEELRAGTREREAGRVNVRKRVRTDREQVRVPTRHEEVSVERVPVNEEASPGQIGEDEVSVPVVEDEVVVEKQPMVKEEIRLRKDAVQDEEIVEEDVRKEEVDIEDTTERRGARGGDMDVDDETRRRNR